MKMSLAFALVFFLAPIIGTASTIEIESTLKVSGDMASVDSRTAKAQGWQLVKDREGEDVYYIRLRVPSSSLPIKRSIGAAAIEVSATGVVRVGVTIGDLDENSDTYVQLPLRGRQIAPLPSAMIIKNYASNSTGDGWSFSGEVKVLVTP